jgi:hypothetical protein
MPGAFANTVFTLGTVRKSTELQPFPIGLLAPGIAPCPIWHCNGQVTLCVLRSIHAGSESAIFGMSLAQSGGLLPSRREQAASVDRSGHRIGRTGGAAEPSSVQARPSMPRRGAVSCGSRGRVGAFCCARRRPASMAPSARRPPNPCPYATGCAGSPGQDRSSPSPHPCLKPLNSYRRRRNRHLCRPSPPPPPGFSSSAQSRAPSD